MKKFICLACGSHWYSASSIDSPCEKCGGKLVDTDSQINDDEADRPEVEQPLH